MTLNSKCQRRSAFTLVELLVVIGIIGLLIGLLLPAVNKVRMAARKTATAATINRLSAACEAYFTAFGSYPGPVANQSLAGGIMTGYTAPQIATAPSTSPTALPLTSTENLTLAILGGLVVRNGNVVYDAALVGSGANNLNPNRPDKHQAYLEVRANELTTNYSNPSATGTLNGGQWDANDTVVPEVLDSFGSPKPILYIRAYRGNAGFVQSSATPSPTDPPQYDVRQLYAYGFPQSATAADDVNYFSNSAMSNTTTNVVQHKDGYLLISAGPDGLYGTADDIKN